MPARGAQSAETTVAHQRGSVIEGAAPACRRRVKARVDMCFAATRSHCTMQSGQRDVTLRMSMYRVSCFGCSDIWVRLQGADRRRRRLAWSIKPRGYWSIFVCEESSAKAPSWMRTLVSESKPGNITNEQDLAVDKDPSGRFGDQSERISAATILRLT